MRLQRESSDPRFTRILDGLYWQIEEAAASGTRLTSRSLWNEAFRLPADRRAQPSIGIYRIAGSRSSSLLVHERAVTIAVDGNDRLIRVSVAIDRAEIDALRVGFTRDMALVAVLLVGVGIRVRTGLLPLDTVRGALQRMRQGTASRLQSMF